MDGIQFTSTRYLFQIVYRDPYQTISQIVSLTIKTEVQKYRNLKFNLNSSIKWTHSI